MVAGRPNRRKFSAHDDEMIIGQARGSMDITVSELRVLCGHVKREALERRAHELGLKLRYKRRNTAKVIVRDRNDTGTNPVIIDGADLLLEKLQLIHGDRRYG